MGVLSVDQESMMDVFSSQLKLLKDMSKPPNKQDGETRFANILNSRQLKLRDVEEEYEGLRRSVEREERALAELEALLHKESMLLSQQETLAAEKAQMARMLNDQKKEYGQRMVRATSKVSTKDQQLLDTFKKKLQAYKKLTGVMFDFPSCNEERISGYLRDTEDRKLKMFHLELERKPQASVIQEFWDLLQQKNGSDSSVRVLQTTTRS